MINRIISWFEKHVLVSWLFTLAIVILIFHMSSREFSSGTPATNLLSVFYHFFVFFFFPLFFLISLIRGKANMQLIIIGVALAIFYGFSDEVHQHFVPGRHCCLEDILTNSAGIMTASVIYLIHYLRNNKREDKKRIIF